MWDIHIENHFMLKDIESDPANFLDKVFHHALRLTTLWQKDALQTRITIDGRLTAKPCLVYLTI